jgi:hypothetical protein
MVQRAAIRSPSIIGPRSTVMAMSPKAAMVCSISGRAFGQALDGFTVEELVVIERYLRRTTEVGSEQTERMRRE